MAFWFYNTVPNLRPIDNQELFIAYGRCVKNVVLSREFILLFSAIDFFVLVLCFH